MTSPPNGPISVRTNSDGTRELVLFWLNDVQLELVNGARIRQAVRLACNYHKHHSFDFRASSLLVYCPDPNIDPLTHILIETDRQFRRSWLLPQFLRLIPSSKTMYWVELMTFRGLVQANEPVHSLKCIEAACFTWRNNEG